MANEILITKYISIYIYISFSVVVVGDVDDVVVVDVEFVVAVVVVDDVIEYDVAVVVKVVLLLKRMAHQMIEID
jgi:hypothetical protein